MPPRTPYLRILIMIIIVTSISVSVRARGFEPGSAKLASAGEVEWLLESGEMTRGTYCEYVWSEIK